MDIMEMGVAGTAVLQEQIMQLANYIMANVEGEPSQSQGAVDTAIRIMGEQAARIAELESELAQRTTDTNVMVGNCEARISELEEQLFRDCENCNGTGKEICNNPDHGFIHGVGGETWRLGCPGCGHDPAHLSKDPCEKCGGTGKINHIKYLESQLAAANAEIERLTAELSPLGLPAPYILRQTDNTK